MSTRQINKGQPRLSSNELQRMWEWLLHEDRLFSERASFFIVAEAMFFSAFAVLADTLSHSSNLIIGIAGIIVAIVWIYTSAIQDFLAIIPIKKVLDQMLPEYKKLSGKVRHYRLNLALGIVLPSLLIVAWIVIIIVN